MAGEDTVVDEAVVEEAVVEEGEAEASSPTPLHVHTNPRVSSSLLAETVRRHRFDFHAVAMDLGYQRAEAVRLAWAVVDAEEARGRRGKISRARAALARGAQLRAARGA